MIVVIPNISVLLPTFLTSIWFYTGVHLHVSLHVVWLAKAFPTHFTTERLLSSVNAVMPPQISQYAKRHAACFTLMWFFTRVNKHMQLKSIGQAESFPTNQAFMDFFFAVQKLVHLQVSLVNERLLAQLTPENLRPCMTLLMCVQARHTAECLPTHLTGEWTVL